MIDNKQIKILISAALTAENSDFRYLLFFGDVKEKFFFSLLKINAQPKISNPSFKIGCSTVVLIFGGWPLIIS